MGELGHLSPDVRSLALSLVWPGGEERGAGGMSTAAQVWCDETRYHGDRPSASVRQRCGQRERERERESVSV